MTGLRLVGADRRRELEARREHVSSERRLRASDAARWGAVQGTPGVLFPIARPDLGGTLGPLHASHWLVGGWVSYFARAGGSHIPSGGMPYARARSLMPVRSVAHNRATSVP